MERFVKFELHEYMDMYPTEEVRTWGGNDETQIKVEAESWARVMNQRYSGGTTRFVCIMSAEQAKDYVDRQIDKEKKNWQSDSQEFINHITNLYNKCYEEA